MTVPAVQITGFTKEFVDPRSREVVRAVTGIDLDIADGEFFALLGPSGCGKTTTLRAIAGFEDPTEGAIRIAGREVQGVPPFHRPVNTVFQDYALFPHMTVLQNVAFGLRMAGTRRGTAAKRALEALEMVRLPEVAGRKPGQLSGGQRQRVALARALVNRPAVLLLDEPLGALDLKLRKAMQLELKELQGRVGITFVYVTHDQEEALTMADRIAVMSSGRVLQVGTPDEIYERPVDRFVADFIGESNFLEGRIVGRNGVRAVLERPGGVRFGGELRDDTLQPGDPATLAVRPEKLDVRPADSVVASEEGAERVNGVVTEVHYLGTDTRYHVRIDEAGVVAAPLVARIQNQHGGFAAARKVGEAVRVSWHPEHASLLR